MRRGILVFLVVFLLLLGLAIRQVLTLLSLLTEDASTDAIHRSDLPARNSTQVNPLQQAIPKIIHQTYNDTSIPTRWVVAQRSCIDLHPDYKYILWTDAKSHDFIAKEYSWFLEAFENYPYTIQRADAIRYFVLAFYGGVYIDLDDGCKRRLDPLLSYTAWLHRTMPTGISNDAMGAVPQHPFFVRVIKELQNYNRGWILPYVTIMGSTGPLFLSVVWKRYMTEHLNEGPEWAGRVRVLMPDEYTNHIWSFFTKYKGDSWHGGDAQFIFWVGSHWMLITAMGFGLAAFIGVLGWYLYLGYCSSTGIRRRSRPHWISRIGRALNFWMIGNGMQAYELVEQGNS